MANAKVDSVYILVSLILIPSAILDMFILCQNKKLLGIWKYCMLENISCFFYIVWKEKGQFPPILNFNVHVNWYEATR